MRTKKADSEPRISRKTVEDFAPVDLPVEPQDDISRLSFAVDSQGNVLWDRMRGKTKEQLKDILTKPETAKALGITQEQASQAVEVFDPAWTGSLYDSLGKIEAMVAGGMLKLSPEVTERVFTYSTMEKEKLAGPTAKVINKYAAVWMVQFKDEIALAFLLVTMTLMKVQIAKTLAATMNVNQSREVTQAPASAPPAPSKTAQEEISELERMAKENPPQDA